MGKKIRERILVQKSAKIVLITFKVRGLQFGRMQSAIGGFFFSETSKAVTSEV